MSFLQKTRHGLIVICCILYLQKSHAQNLSLSLTACYNMNGHVIDAVNGLNGGFYSGPGYCQPDRFNNPNSAMRIIGAPISAHVYTLPPSPLLRPAHEITFSAWINHAGGTNFAGTSQKIVYAPNSLFLNGTPTNSHAYQLEIVPTASGYKFSAGKSGPLGNDSVYSNAVLQSGWQHVAFTMNDSSIRLYVNGVPENSVACSFPGFDHPQNAGVLLGMSGYNNSAILKYFDGMLDNVRFYNRVLSATEINMLYTQDPSCFSAPTLPNCSKYYAITEGAIYEYDYGPVTSVKAVNAILPSGAVGLAVGPKFGFNAPDPTFWTTAGGTFWYYNGLNFINTHDSCGSGVTDIGGSAHFIYAQSHPNWKIYKYNGSGNAAYLTTIIYNNINNWQYANDLAGDDLDNFYTFSKYNAMNNYRVYNANGALNCDIAIINSYGYYTQGFAMNSHSIAIIDYDSGNSTGLLWNGYRPSATQAVANVSLTAIVSNNGAYLNDLASCPVHSSFSVNIGQTYPLSCPYPTIQIMAGVNNDQYGYQYAFTSPSGAITNSNIISVNSPGVYSLSVSNSCAGANLFSTYTVQTASLPLQLSFSPSNPTVCLPGGSVTLTASGANNYTWSTPSSLSSSVGSIVFASPLVATIYTVNGTTTGTCTGTGTVSVMTASVPFVTASQSAGSVCAGQSITLSASGADNYTWTPLSGLSSGSGSQVVANPAASTSYTVSGSAGICQNTATVGIITFTPAAIVVSQSSDSLCIGQSASLSLTGALNYTWQPGGLFGNNQLLVPAADIVYTITGTDIHGCMDSTTVSLFVSACTGINEFTKENFSVYPNPVRNKLIVECDVILSELKIDIINSIGVTLFECNMPNQKAILDLSAYPEGLYTVRYSSNGKIVVLKKIVKN